MPVVPIGAPPPLRSYRIHRSPVAGTGAGAQVKLYVRQKLEKSRAAAAQGRSAS
jgi:hypothetical protein